jgi:hypothetical protein
VNQQGYLCLAPADSDWNQEIIKKKLSSVIRRRNSQNDALLDHL